MSRRPWFVRRAIGFGWRPVTWQAWVITAVAAVIVVFAAATARIAKAPAMIAVVAAVLALYSITAAALSRSVAPAEPSLTPPPPVDPVPRQPAVPSVRRPEPVSDATRAPALAVEHLTKRFGQRVAFEDVSFSVAAGEVFGFLGPNGAGKTTTVRTLGTLLTPSAGTATVVGLELTERNGQEIRQRISIMPESPGLYLRLSVRENLELFAGLFNVTNARTRIGEALDAVNMAARADDICANLSKGLRQRVGLARALLNDPDILFLDEPTSGLDPVATREVHDLIVGLRSRGVTVFLTTHRLEEAERLCDRVAILNTTLRMLGRPDELRAQLFSRSLVVITAAPLAEPGHTFDEVGGVQSWQLDDTGRYVLTVDDAKAVAPPLTRALVAAGADVQAVYETQHTLEDVYMELISDDVEARVR